jgi:hypothetical protein
VKKYWPTGNPSYWRPTTNGDERALAGLLWRVDLQRDDGGEARDPAEVFSGNDDMDDQGVANRKGGGMIQRKRYPPSFYPVSSTISADKWSSYPGARADLIPEAKGLVVNQIDFTDEATRGFGYCYVDPGYVIHGELGERLDREADLLARVDTQMIAGGAKWWRGTGVNLPFFFERDEYFFRSYELLIDSMRGDV